MIDISVIIPVYKGNKYLKYLLKILRENFNYYEQIYKMQCEVVFINDYPKERLIIEEQKNIHVYNLETNRGIHGARIFGYLKAKGNYVVFLDQDDKISENYLVSQKEKIGFADAVICNGYRERICIKGRRAIYTQETEMKKAITYANYIYEKNWIRSPGQVLLKKSAIPDLWLNQVMKQNGADDYFLWILMLKNQCVFAINQARIYTHMEYGNNTSNGNEAMRKSLVEMVLLLKKNDVLPDHELREIENRYCKKNEGDLIRTIKVYDYWMYLKIRNRKIESYFKYHKYKKIAIYGINYLGNRLYDELSYSTIEVLFGIDKAAEGIDYDIPILSMDNIKLWERMQEIDVVVVTAVAFYQNILWEFQKISDKPVLSMENILLELINFNELNTSL